MKPYALSLFCICIFSPIILVATAGRSSEEGEEKPLRNYFGTVEDADGNNFPVEYIALRSPTLTSKIPVFIKPSDPAVDPRRNASFLNLQDISDIHITIDHEAHKTFRFNNIEYVSIRVRLKGPQPTTHEYIIEAQARLWCTESESHAPIRKEIQFIAVKHIHIAGFRSADIHQRAPSVTAHS